METPRISQLILLIGTYLFSMDAVGVSLDVRIEDEKFPTALSVFVPCKIGKKEFSCHLDTGMKMTEVSDKSSNDFKFVRKGRSGNIDGKFSPCRELVAPKIALGSKTKEDVVIQNCEGHRLHPKVIGINFFANERFRLNLKEKTLSFDLNPITEGPRFIYLRDSYIGLPVTIGKVGMLGLFDTGAGLTVVDESLLGEEKDNFGVHSEVDVDTPNGKTKAKVYFLRKLRTGDETIENVQCLAMPFKFMKETFGSDVRVIIGNNLISQYDWSFDSIHRTYRSSKLP